MKMPPFPMVLILLIVATTVSSNRRMKRAAADYGSGLCLKSLTGSESTQDIVSVCVGKAGTTCHDGVGVHIGKGRVLTAAHCLFTWPHRKGSVCKATRRNDYFTIVSDRSKITVSGSKAVHHRFYSHDSWLKNLYLRYDAAVIFTGSHISNERTCPTMSARPSTNDTCYVYKRNHGYKRVSLLPCRLGSLYTKTGQFRSDLLCIKAIDNLTFASGDSGSPVYCMSSSGEYYLRGIISARYTSPKSAIVLNTPGNIPIESEMNGLVDCRAK